ncbi:carbohydrate kinase family protein [Candidatus Gracilibacteria bacterium]|nr:carbohydrate kinase family protein [Candidatus Gracilibacteria bacterium]
MENKTEFDFISIGDTVIDAFIKLSEGHIQESAHGSEICLPYGAKIPFDDVYILPAVGNSANAAVSAARLSLKTGIITSIGNDTYGQDCITQFTKDNVATDFIRKEDGKKTNYHYVLWKGVDRTILIKHEEFTPSIPEIGSPKWMYLSSLGKHTLPFHFDIIAYLDSHPEVNFAFQPGTFQLAYGHEIVDLYKKTTVVCMNKEEAEGLLDMEGADMIKLLDGLEAFGPKTVIITDGHQGSYMKYENSYFNMPIYPDIAAPYERTGAGDAFFSTFVAYMAKGFDATEAIKRAPINSMNVVQHIGAQEGLMSEEKIEEYLKNAPESYKLTILEPSIKAD